MCTRSMGRIFMEILIRSCRRRQMDNLRLELMFFAHFLVYWTFVSGFCILIYNWMNISVKRSGRQKWSLPLIRRSEVFMRVRLCDSKNGWDRHSFYGGGAAFCSVILCGRLISIKGLLCFGEGEMKCLVQYWHRTKELLNCE